MVIKVGNCFVSKIYLFIKRRIVNEEEGKIQQMAEGVYSSGIPSVGAAIHVFGFELMPSHITSDRHIVVTCHQIKKRDLNSTLLH